jgi:tetratricopeptide (TPR) repeat protein
MQAPLSRAHTPIINWNYVIIALAIAVFIFSCFQLDITQDDAYISFRYAANYLSGHGLVYNYGERVEGYTNFLWVMLLALFKGVFGVSYFTFSRIAGVISGAMIFYLLYLLLQHHFKKVPLIVHISLMAVMLCNLSLPYWSIASLETAAFACMVLAAVVAEYRRSELTPALLIIATLLRPEGVVVFGVVLINRIIVERRPPWRYILMYIIPLLPFAVFKLAYYGSLFPNPYYAKSGVGLEYIQSGLEYLWYFTRTVGVYGIVFIVPLLAMKKLWRKYSLLYLYVLLYLAYIVWVGGDVLKVYRFFVPVVPVLYFLFVVSLVEMISLIGVNRQRINIAIFLCTVAFSFTSYLLSQEHIWANQKTELILLDKMNFVSTMLKKHMGNDFSLATSTIGMAGYQLLGHRVIDMLGLTDSYIARNPEQVEGMIPSWKERRFNSRYLLEQQPDFILFSTDYKPSAPAERALMLHSEFRRTYSTVGFMRDKSCVVAWQRKRPINMSRDVVHPDIEFVNSLSDGFYFLLRDRYNEALPYFLESQRRLGEDFTMLSHLSGECYLRMNRVDSALIYFQKALQLDTLCWEARIELVEIASKTGDAPASIKYVGDLKRLFPWIFDKSNHRIGDFRADESFLN